MRGKSSEDEELLQSLEDRDVLLSSENSTFQLLFPSENREKNLGRVSCGEDGPASLKVGKGSSRAEMVSAGLKK